MVKSCEYPDICNQTGSGSVGTTNILFNTKCCSSDLCNYDSALNFPAVNNTQNGLTCKACTGGNTQDCFNNAAPVPCTGNQDRCLVSSGSLYNKPYVISGCASSSACNFLTVISNGLLSITRTQCFSASPMVCYNCSGTPANCTNEVIACDASMACLKSSVRLLFGGETHDLIVKKCGRQDICNQQITGNFGSTKLYVQMECCSSDFCNSDSSLNISGISSTPNDLNCKTCSSATKQDCDKNNTVVQCTGNQDHCISSSGTFFTNSHHYFTGCASGKIFSNKSLLSVLSGNMVNIEEDMQCAMNSNLSIRCGFLVEHSLILLASIGIYTFELFI
ncbi:protein psiQ-like [Protopterus annectens]|uniref:protein psiQ-like n=1 Tax=Protopterus annectens TaxID=7888 RepID=UPI001CF9B708|nr:protein psiQ-like [Protopterus annectens]